MSNIFELSIPKYSTNRRYVEYHITIITDSNILNDINMSDYTNNMLNSTFNKQNTLNNYNTLHNYNICNNTFYIVKRYSDFLNLHNELMQHIIYLPEFPKKVFFNKNTKVLQHRREKLEIYMKYVARFIIQNNYINTKCGRLLIDFLNK